MSSALEYELVLAELRQAVAGGVNMSAINELLQRAAGLGAELVDRDVTERISFSLCPEDEWLADLLTDTSSALPRAPYCGG